MKSLFKATLMSAALALTAAPSVFADAAVEQYVNINANRALESLSTPGLTRAECRVQFNALMDEFTDMELIAMRVLGKYYRQFDDAEKEEFKGAFRDFALATYEAELSKYRGSNLRVITSQDRAPNKRTKVDSVVTTVIDLPAPREDLQVLWRVVEFQPDSRYAEVFGEGYKVTDVALDLEGGRIWLANIQREQFLSILDRNGGNAADLITRVRALTADLNEKVELDQAAASLETVSDAG